jgi:hypothetical protein
VPNVAAQRAIEDREDISQYILHLTRDDRADDPHSGATARDNFENILKHRRIIALRPHCLHGDSIKRLPDDIRQKFNVACFTETPLTQLKSLLDIPGRKVNLEPYGFVFSRSFLEENNGQEVTYIHEYGSQSQRAAYDSIYRTEARANFSGPTWRLLPFVNIRHEGHDFFWEREWRVLGDLVFKTDDLVCVILPERESELRSQMATKGIAAICPEWGYEKMIGQLASQQRRTMRIWSTRPSAPPPKALSSRS